MRIYFYSALLLAFSVLNFSSCSKSVSEKKKENPAEPYERFAAQRAYPDAVFDLKAFETLLQEEHLNIASQKKFSSLSWVLEGPTNIGGRITCLAVSPTRVQAFIRQQTQDRPGSPYLIAKAVYTLVLLVLIPTTVI